MFQWESFIQSRWAKEILQTDGIGGYAMTTLSGLNTRKYHGYLVAAFEPPVDRHVLWSSAVEELLIDGKSHLLSTLAGQRELWCKGHQYLNSFQPAPVPRWIWMVDGCIVEKELIRGVGQPVTALRYTVHDLGGREICLKVAPLVTCRSFHHTTREGDFFAFWSESHAWGGLLQLGDRALLGMALLSNRNVIWEHTIDWYKGAYYFEETLRGLDDQEDLIMAGQAKMEFRGSGTGIVALWLDSAKEQRIQWQQAFPQSLEAWTRATSQLRSNRYGYWQRKSNGDQVLSKLLPAADNFLVSKQPTSVIRQEKVSWPKADSILAGYPWFNDWGRDTFISLPGLCLVPGRIEEAQRILETFASHRWKGIIPNMFADNQRNYYNTVDATLWWIWALDYYLRSLEDWEKGAELIQVAREMIQCYADGTAFDIGVDCDGLLTAGNEKTQLTWMDAKVGEWVVTPRQGKTVEINALWHHALSLLEAWEQKKPGLIGKLPLSSGKVAKSFQQTFWNPKKKCLYDLVNKQGPDETVRMNQLLAIALPHQLIPLDEAKSVLRTVANELLTPMGLRSLSPKDARYRGIYIGNPLERDGAYHQGTVWGWWLGFYLDALHNLWPEEAPKWSEYLLSGVLQRLDEDGIGSINEIFDGDPPHHPRGCPFQAWSVAEILRSYFYNRQGTANSWRNI